MITPLKFVPTVFIEESNDGTVQHHNVHMIECGVCGSHNFNVIILEKEVDMSFVCIHCQKRYVKRKGESNGL